MNSFRKWIMFSAVIWILVTSFVFANEKKAADSYREIYQPVKIDNSILCGSYLKFLATNNSVPSIGEMQKQRALELLRGFRIYNLGKSQAEPSFADVNLRQYEGADSLTSEQAQQLANRIRGIEVGLETDDGLGSPLEVAYVAEGRDQIEGLYNELFGEFVRVAQNHEFVEQGTNIRDQLMQMITFASFVTTMVTLGSRLNPESVSQYILNTLFASGYLLGAEFFKPLLLHRKKTNSLQKELHMMVHHGVVPEDKLQRAEDVYEEFQRTAPTGLEDAFVQNLSEQLIVSGRKALKNWEQSKKYWSYVSLTTERPEIAVQDPFILERSMDSDSNDQDLEVDDTGDEGSSQKLIKRFGFDIASATIHRSRLFLFPLIVATYLKTILVNGLSIQALKSAHHNNKLMTTPRWVTLDQLFFYDPKSEEHKVIIFARSAVKQPKPPSGNSRKKDLQELLESMQEEAPALVPIPVKR